MAAFDQQLTDACQSIVAHVVFDCVSLGTSFMDAIRTQVDLMLGFTYFREHTAEWRLVNSTGDGFRLRAEIVKYQCEMEPGRGGFKDRLGIMDQVCKPTLEE
jgi:hypothetical protein